MKSIDNKIDEYIMKSFKIEKNTLELCNHAEEKLQPVFKNIDKTAQYNQYKVLKAMHENRLSDAHFSATTGYGYNDLGRDTLENIYASVFKAEAALVRPQIISGTHALTIALSGNLHYGDEILSPVGKPYDTLEGVIGTARAVKGSLKENGISYKQVDLLPDGTVDYDSIASAVTSRTKLASIQRSKGYEYRESLSIESIRKIIEIIKSVNRNIICMVDNCYGEFVDLIEPYEIGADLVVGSLIKNPGGGLAPVGGYIVGKNEYVENAAVRLTAPGLGREVGPTLGLNQQLIQGLFLAPQVVSAALKGAAYAAEIFSTMGYEVMPKPFEKRNDIVQAIQLKSPENVIRFCRGIQEAAPVDSFAAPEPWDMPGYDCPVIMAAGAFVQGSSIEFSADAPMKEPYTVFMQGGLTWHHAKIGVMLAANYLRI